MKKIKFLISKLIQKIFWVSSINNSDLHETCRIGNACNISGTRMKRYSYAGEHTLISHTSVGCFTSISSYCAIGGGAHPTDWVSTSPVFTSERSILRCNFSEIPFDPYLETKIGNDVWIGAHCLIKSGVTIGDGAIIGMGSVVTKTVGPYEVWVGNPAHMIRKRFDDDIISELLNLKWWDWSDDKIKKYAHLFDSPKALMAELEKKEA